MVKIWLLASSSTTTPVNAPSPGAVQRTDPTKSDVSVRGNNSSMYRACCPLASKGISASSSTMAPLINWQLTSIASSPGLWIAAAVLRSPSRRAGKRASLTG